MRRWTALVAAVVLACLAVCGDDRPASDPPGAEAYAIVIGRFLPPGVPAERPVVFVVPVNGDPLAIDTQVGVIDALADGRRRTVRRQTRPRRSTRGRRISRRATRARCSGSDAVSVDPPYTVRVELYDRTATRSAPTC